MTIELRQIESATDADVFLSIRARIDPGHVPSRTAYLEHIRDPGRVDLLALVDGVPVGTGFVEPHPDDRDASDAWASVRVLREHRRQGVGTELFRALSVRARAAGRTALTMSVRHDDTDAFDYLSKRGFVEVLRVCESVLELDGAGDEEPPPEGVALVPITEELEPRVYAAAVEIARDIPAHDEVRVGSFEQWLERELSCSAFRDCSLTALDGLDVAGYAILHDGGDGDGLHAMTGVRRPWRRRGIAMALKRAQIDAARRRGLRRLRAANAVQNPMLAVNERLGFVRDVDWLHLRGPLLDAESS
jgi:GNAT superfamily N-acetyltransferase